MKKLVRAENETVIRHFDLLGEEFDREEDAESSSKRYLIKNQIRRLRVAQRELIAAAVVDLEELGVVKIDWDSLLKES